MHFSSVSIQILRNGIQTIEVNTMLTLNVLAAVGESEQSVAAAPQNTNSNMPATVLVNITAGKVKVVPPATAAVARTVGAVPDVVPYGMKRR